MTTSLSDRLAGIRRSRDEAAAPQGPSEPAAADATPTDAGPTEAAPAQPTSPSQVPDSAVQTVAGKRRANVPALGPEPVSNGSTANGSTANGSTANGSPSTVSRRPAAHRLTLPSSQTDRLDEVKAQVHSELVSQLGPELYTSDMDHQELDRRVRGILSDVLATQEQPISSSDRAKITRDIGDDILGYGPIEPYLRDPAVSEVMVNGHDSVWLEKDGRLTPADATFDDEAHLRRTIDKIVSRIGRRVDESSPMVDARLPDGSRVNAVIPPLTVDGSALTIRKFAADPLTAEDLVRFGSISRQTRDFLDACVRGRLNVIVSGSTGAGKTTTLNVLSSFIPGDERIVTIEDAAELQLKQEHVVRLESRPANIEGKGSVTIRDLVKNSLRMRPDRIIVGEVRDASALDMLQAMNTGHDGSICTLHSNGPRDTLSRMETMVLMAGMDLPIRAIREQVAAAVDLVVHQTRFKDGSRRITHITEVERMEGDVITLQDIFVYDHGAGFDQDGKAQGHLRATGLRPKFLEKMAQANVTVDPVIFAADRL